MEDEAYHEWNRVSSGRDCGYNKHLVMEGMKLRRIGWLALSGWGFLASVCPAQPVPVDLSDRIGARASDSSILDRARNRIESTVQVTLTSNSVKQIEAPLHAVIEFSSADSLSNLNVGGGALGGPGIAPYQTWYYDLSGQIPDGLGTGEEIGFTLQFDRPREMRISYLIRPHGVVNQDPLALAGGPYRAAVNEPVNFDGTASSDPDEDPITFEWDLGGGDVAMTAIARKSFDTPGVHEAML